MAYGPWRGRDQLPDTEHEQGVWLVPRPVAGWLGRDGMERQERGGESTPATRSSSAWAPCRWVHSAGSGCSDVTLHRRRGVGDVAQHPVTRTVVEVERIPTEKCWETAQRRNSRQARRQPGNRLRGESEGPPAGTERGGGDTGSAAWA